MGYFGVHLARRSLERTRIFHDTRGRNKSAVGSEKEGRIGGGVRRGGGGGVGFRGIEGDPRESPQLCLYVCCFRAWMTNL